MATGSGPVATASVAAFQTAAKLHSDGKFAEAEAVLREALAADPGNSDLRNAHGVMFAAMGRHLDALWCYREALARNPRSPGIWTNMGNTLAQLKHLRGAVACHQRAIGLSGNDALLHYNLGTALIEAGQHGEAVVAFTRALELNPAHHMARWDRARGFLFLGNYTQGLADYEARYVTGQLPPRELPGTKWDGRSYAGRRLLLITEQGFGDTLWVARYLPRVKALGGELIIECQNELLPLLEAMGAADKLIPRGAQNLPEADFHLYMCSLPGLFTLDLSSIPTTSYLPAPQNKMEKFRQVFARAGRRLKVGIVWSGSVTFRKNHERAQPLLRFLQSFALPGVQLYSLQKGLPADAVKALPQSGPVTDLAPLLDDFADTAAAIAHLDLVIMTDSAVAHLAGGMGKPVWVLLGHAAHWLWLLQRTDSPWYPTARLFRPRGEGDWDYVFDCASVELMKLAQL
jgi:Flp pilus assembly protein TadD